MGEGIYILVTYYNNVNICTKYLRFNGPSSHVSVYIMSCQSHYNFINSICRRAHRPSKSLVLGWTLFKPYYCCVCLYSMFLFLSDDTVSHWLLSCCWKVWQLPLHILHFWCHLGGPLYVSYRGGRAAALLRHPLQQASSLLTSAYTYKGNH